jgi:poly-gamma-glutamate capsule biosynthesis protein CapA/YwtB (metallophosphatase superfamily)
MKKGILFFVLFFLFIGVGWYWYIQVGRQTTEVISPLSHYFQSTITPSPSKTTIIFTGDVMLGRTTEITTREKKNFNYPFLKVADVLKQADLTFVNLENPITKDCEPFRTGFIFCANPEMLAGLTFSGVDMVTLANNHTHNHGQIGIDQTVQFLNEKEIGYTGLGNLATKQVNNVTFGFLGFDKAQLGDPQLTKEEKQLLLDSDKKVDVLIVAMHWGVEYKSVALLGVRKLAKELVELGADVVIGSHPHWVQDREYISEQGSILQKERTDPVIDIKGYKPIYYSLGNFVFDQMWSEETRKGLVVRLTFDGKELEKEDLLPIYIKDRGQPEFVQ